MVRYLALTAGELCGETAMQEKPAYMACHFSLYNTGLSNLPRTLPPGSMLILNDQIPFSGHDPHRIVDQLLQTIKHFSCDSLLLDFQRPGNAEVLHMCHLLSSEITCPMGISHHYADDLECAVFLPPPPLDVPLGEYLHPWKNRKIWLESALEGADFTITTNGCKTVYLPFEPPTAESFIDETLHCRYRCQVDREKICFHLYRTVDQLEALLDEADTLGIERSIGLYQQLGKRKPLVD